LKRTWKRITDWELWPFKVIYAPLGFLWAYYAIKARAFWFFSNVNPTLEFSGFEGETKKEMYDQLPKHYYPETFYVSATEDFNEVQNKLNNSNISYPFIAKPEIGMQGILVRKITNLQQLEAYHKRVQVNYLVQGFIDLPVEFSVFHIRYPGEKKGIVTGFILKEYLQVFGDGKSTLLQLIQHHPKAKHREEEMRHMHGNNLQTVLAQGEKYSLSFTGNHNRGAKFINLHKEIDQRLCDVFDKISVEAGQFHFGRYDLKCTSIEDLKAGKNISILEFNGAGAEPNHIYDCGMSYFEALKEIARHWEHLYRISRINYKKGIPYWSFSAGKKQLDKAGKFFEKLRRYDLQF
jgi:hypothetical protein